MKFSQKKKINPKPNKTEQLQRSVDNIEHYKGQGTIIRRKKVMSRDNKSAS